MVIYYSWSGNTEAYARKLAEKLKTTVFRLEEKRPRNGKAAFYKACLQTMIKIPSRPVTMPNLSGCDELYLCTPVWGKGPAPAVSYFLNHADLKGKTVHILFTYGGMTPPETFLADSTDLLKHRGAAAGNMQAFTAKFKQPSDPETVSKDISNSIFNASKKGVTHCL